MCMILRDADCLGFRKIETDRWEFANEDFLRGSRHLLKNIHRRKSLQGQHIGNYAVSSGETGRSGLEGEIQKLRNGKNFLMQELLKLQQEHRGRAHQVEAMKQRMEVAEQRQKQMVSFLAKVLQNPVFLTRLQQMKEQREIASPRVKRKFFKQQPLDESKLATSMERKIVKYKPDLGDLATSSVLQDIEPVTDKQLTGDLLEAMVGKLGLCAAHTQGQIGNVVSDELGQELVGASGQMGMDTLGLGSLGCEKGKEVVRVQPEVGADYFVSSPEDLVKEKSFPDFMSPTIESIIKQEDIWGMGFDTSFSMPTSGHEIWGDLVDYDAQELGVTAGLSNLWDQGLQEVAGGSGSNMWPGDESSFDDLESKPDN
ncbi:Heat shock transcription factor [Macleaya cordata]|uniref:Heat shock transcription factor n=1 Tax=Macleaya cordata TaxID=56857 RepID=A0A200R569_MACCD|nr:Heat shock transcription factor [Macleaya cordata]